MHRINYNVIDRMLKNQDNGYYNSIMFNINLMIDYAKHVSTMSDRINELCLIDNGETAYLIRSIEKQRQEKHDMAINALYELNNIAEKIGCGIVYEGSFDNPDDRGDIAQAIFEFCKQYF